MNDHKTEILRLLHDAQDVIKKAFGATAVTRNELATASQRLAEIEAELKEVK